MTEPRAMKLLFVGGRPAGRRQIPDRLASAGYQVTIADDPRAALSLLRNQPDSFDGVVFRVSRDVSAGLSFLATVKSDPAIWNTPVIMQTGRDLEDEQTALIEQGAHFCIHQGIDDDMLRSVVRTSVIDGRRTNRIREEVRERTSGIGRILAATFEIQTLDESRKLATMLSLPCPDPQSTAIGLSELMTNAIEHGNLGITYDEKSRLLESSSWMQEIERRLALPENRSKSVIIEFEERDDAFLFRIKDQGTGFDPKPFMEVDKTRSGHPHGRGIAMATRYCFDRVEYVGRGNEVIATISSQARKPSGTGE